MVLDQLVDKLFFTQERVGLGGDTFTLYKFKTMREGESLSASERWNLNEMIHKGVVDRHPRTTPVGYWLRRTKIDELPQLVNILKGEMRFFGARPITSEHFERLPQDLQEKRKGYRPGFLCPDYADQVKSWGEKVECERRYFDRFEEEPLKTNISYFLRCVYTVLVKGYRGPNVRSSC